MAITFPINPQHGQQYNDPGIPATWQYDVGRNAWRVVRTGPAWFEIIGKPATFPPDEHEHAIAEVNGLQETLNEKQDLSGRAAPNGYASLDGTGKVPENQLPFGVAGDWNDITNKPSEFPPSPHSHPVAQISDSGSTGQQLVRAPTPADARNIIGAIGVDDNARVTVKKNDVLVGVRRAVNFHEGANVTMTVTDDVASEEVDVTINAAGGGGGGSALTVSEIKPVAPFANDMWLDVATGLKFIYYNDGDTSQWIEALPYLQTMPGAFTKFNFPASPINDQLFNPIPGATWKWSTSRGVWYAVSTTSGSYTQAEADAKFVDIVGDVMTGPLSVVHPPTANTHAASKQYVDSKPGIIISDTAPVSPIDGSVWWESDSGLMYIRYNDGTSSQWVIASPQPDFNVFATKAETVGSVHYDAVQSLTVAQQTQGRQNIYAAPFDAMAYSGMQINGGGEVSQELGAGGRTTYGYIRDGWAFYFAGTMALGAGGGGSVVPGFPQSFYIQCTTAQTSLGANDMTILYTYIEGYRSARLSWGTSGAQPITISFWSRHNRPGTYSCVVRNNADNRTYATTYTQASSGVAQYNSILIPGDTAGTWTSDNTRGIGITFAMASGSSTIAPSANTWLSGVYQAAPGQVNGVAATSDIFYITGVTVLPGNEAPSAARSALAMRPFDQELQICKRYWQSWYMSVVPTNVPTVVFPVEMRALPTITGGGAGFGAVGTTTKSSTPYQTTGAFQTLVFDARL